MDFPANMPRPILGACGWSHFEELKAAGANSMRTWGGAVEEKAFDECERLGISLCAGIPLVEASTPEMAANLARDYVARHKHFKCVYAWGVGNEIESKLPSPVAWEIIEAAARAVKAEDPERLRMAVLAEFTDEKILAVEGICESINILGINAYGSVGSITARMAAIGQDRPYIITEWGMVGPWESAVTSWGTLLESTSTVSALAYCCNYKNLIQPQINGGKCLGSYVYLWGAHTQSKTCPNWGEMFLPSGEPLETVEVMAKCWSGRPKDPDHPMILAFDKRPAKPSKAALEGILSPGEHVTVTPIVCGDCSKMRWELRSEDINAARWFPAEMPVVHGALAEADGGKSVVMTAPKTPGHYRLFLYAMSKSGKAAWSGIPFKVK